MKLNLTNEVTDYNKVTDFSPSSSLTPRNNKSKQRFSFKKEGEMQDDADDTIVGHLYTYSNDSLKAGGQVPAEVKHYSIDTASAKKSIEKFNSQTENFKDKTGGGSKTSKTTYKANDEKKLLHECETILIEKALSENERVILVDIFARNDDGTIKLQGENPETHTVILCKGAGGKILVIDPNNSSFSSHLSTQYNQGKTLEVAPSLCKIYEPVNKGNIAKNINSSRDCIDIAIKLAYKLSSLESSKISFNEKGFNPQSKKSEIFINDSANEIIKLMSNNSKYDDGIDKLILNEQGFLMIPAKLKQVTKDGYGKKFYDNELKVIEQLELKNEAIAQRVQSTTKDAVKTLKNTLKESMIDTSLKFDVYISGRESYKNKIIETYDHFFKKEIDIIKDSPIKFNLLAHANNVDEFESKIAGEVTFDSYMEE